MYVRELKLINIRGFTEESFRFARQSDGALAGWHVIAGRNGAGKSSVLSALALALRGDRYAYRLESDFEGWVRRGAEQAEIVVSVESDAERDRLSVHVAVSRGGASSAGEEDPPRWVAQQRAAAAPPRFEAGLVLSRANRGEPIAIDDQGPARRGPWSGAEARGWMLAAYGPQRRLSGHSAEAQRLMSDRSGVGSIITLFRPDASLAEASVWLRELHLAGERAPITADEVVALLNDGLLPDGMRAQRLDDEGVLQLEQAGIELTLAQLSDGYRAVISLVLDLLFRLSAAYGRESLRLRRREGGSIQVDLPGVVLIDEAETHLHPDWQQRLGFWLVEHFPALQFIVTTHSPFVCQAALHGSLTGLARPGGQLAQLALDARDFWSVVYGSPDEAVLSELFGLEQLRSPAALEAREELARLEVRQLRGERLSKRDKARLDELIAQQPKDPRLAFERFSALTRELEP